MPTIEEMMNPYSEYNQPGLAQEIERQRILESTDRNLATPMPRDMMSPEALAYAQAQMGRMSPAQLADARLSNGIVGVNEADTAKRQQAADRSAYYHARDMGYGGESDFGASAPGFTGIPPVDEALDTAAHSRGLFSTRSSKPVLPTLQVNPALADYARALAIKSGQQEQ